MEGRKEGRMKKGGIRENGKKSMYYLFTLLVIDSFFICLNLNLSAYKL